MHDYPIGIPHQEARACGEGGEFIHEVEEEYLLEGVVA